jgi:hypothetical protein
MPEEVIDYSSVNTVILDIDQTIPANDKVSKKWTIATGRKAFVLGVNCTNNSNLLLRIKHKGKYEMREWKATQFNTSPEKMYPLFYEFGSGELELEVANVSAGSVATVAGLLVVDVPDKINVMQILELYR